MKKSIFALALIFSAPLHAANESHYVMAYVPELEIAGATVSEYCSSTDSKAIPGKSIVLVTGMRTCERKYLPSVEFYEIAWRGKTYFIEQSKMNLKDDDLARIKGFTPEQWSLARNEGIEASSIIRAHELKPVIDAVDTAKAYGLSVIDWAVVDESEYTKGTGLRLEVYNPTRKTIKYIWFSVQGKNPVGDAVGGVRTVKAVGPIEPDSGGSYRFEYTWMTDLVETAVFKSIKVQYMDGSVKVITHPDRVMMDDDVANIFKE